MSKCGDGMDEPLALKTFGALSQEILDGNEKQGVTPVKA